MYIQTATFTIAEQDEERLTHKANHDLESLENWDACLGAEYWVSKEDGKVSYTLVSRWQDKKDFQAWLGRPEHKEMHRQAAAKQKEHPEEVKPKIDRSSQGYELFEK